MLTVRDFQLRITFNNVKVASSHYAEDTHHHDVWQFHFIAVDSCALAGFHSRNECWSHRSQVVVEGCVCGGGFVFTN